MVRVGEVRRTRRRRWGRERDRGRGEHNSD